MCIARRRLYTPVTEQPADREQAFARHDRMARKAVPEIVDAHAGGQVCFSPDLQPNRANALISLRFSHREHRFVGRLSRRSALR